MLKEATRLKHKSRLMTNWTSDEKNDVKKLSKLKWKIEKETKHRKSAKLPWHHTFDSLKRLKSRKKLEKIEISLRKKLEIVNFFLKIWIFF